MPYKDKSAEKAHSAAYYKAHKTEMSNRMRAWNQAHKAETRVQKAVYYQTHKTETKARHVTYYQAHKTEIGARAAAYRQTHRGAVRTLRQAYRATAFLKQRPDCTSTKEDVKAIYAAAVSALDGLPCCTGKEDYHLDHIHGGPAVGLVPAGLNRWMTERNIVHFDEAEAARWLNPNAIAYIKRRIALADKPEEAKHESKN